MNILMIFGNKHDISYFQLDYKKSIINKIKLSLDEAVEILEKGQMRPDKIIIDTGALDLTLSEIKEKISIIEALFINKYIIVITNRLEVKDIVTKLQKQNPFIQLEYMDQIVITSYVYNKIFAKIIFSEDDMQTAKKSNKDKEIGVNENHLKNSPKKTSLFKKIFNKSNEEPEESAPISSLDKKLGRYSKGINRVIAITGHRGIGCTSTAVNIAHEAARRGLNTIIVDMDIENRSLNLYFNNFVESCENNKDMVSSLIRCLAKPQEYKHHACYINNKLWVTGLAYEFQDDAVIDRFYNTNKFINMLTILRQNFNIIVLDLPFDILSKFEEAIIHIDTFGLCASNNLYSIVTTLRNISTSLSRENIAYLNGKSKLIATQYNDRMQYQGEVFTAEQMSELFASDLSDDFNIAMSVAGVIRYTEEFDMQIETDICISSSSNEYKEYYSNILLRLLEGER